MINKPCFKIDSLRAIRALQTRCPARVTWPSHCLATCQLRLARFGAVHKLWTTIKFSAASKWQTIYEFLHQKSYRFKRRLLATGEPKYPKSDRLIQLYNSQKLDRKLTSFSSVFFFLPPKNMSIGHWEVLTYLRICPNYSKEELLKKFYFLFTRKPHSIERKAPLSLCWISRNPPELRLAFGQISIHTAMQTVCHRKYAMQTRMPRISQTASQAAAFENTQVEK